MSTAKERKLLPAGEIDAGYLKLLEKFGDDKGAEYYDLRTMSVGMKSTRFGMDSAGGLSSGGQEKNFETKEPNKNKWGSVSHRILQPEEPPHGQPIMRRKNDEENLKKAAEKNKKLEEDAFAMRSDVWLSEIEQTVDRGSLIAFTVYVLFLAVGIIIIYGVLEVGYNYYATTLFHVFTHTPFNTSLGISKTFEEVRTIEQLWDYIERVFLRVMYGYSQNHTRSVVIDKSGVFWLFENILVGTPRIRQLRVKNGSCFVASAVADLFHSCYGYYSDGWMDKDPFGLKTPAPWRYSEPNSGSAVYSGKISSYGGGGYQVNITSDGKKTTALIQELKDNKWIRKGARAVFIDFTTYTPNNNLFCVVKLVFELPPSGGVIPTAHFYTMRFLRYVGTFDYIIFGAEITFCGFIVWFTAEEILDLFILRKKYFFSLWNIVDVTILITSYVTILAGLARYTIVELNMQDYVDQIALGHHQSFDKLLEAQLVFNTGIAVLSFLVWFKLLKFAVLFKSMAVIFSVFGHIKFHILPLILLIAVTIFGFALVATMLFGSEVEQFTTLWNSLFSLVGLFFGGLYFYPRCAATHRRLAPVFFMLYIFTVFILLVNIYVALVVHGFRKAVNVLEDERERQYIWDILYKIFHRIMVVMRMKKKAAQMKYKLEAAENKKRYKELVRIVKKHGFRGNAVVILFRKHEVFPDWPLPFQKASEVYEEIDTLAQLYMEISEHDRLMSNVDKAARKVELLDRAVSDMMINVEVLVADLLYEEKVTN